MRYIYLFALVSCLAACGVQPSRMADYDVPAGPRYVDKDPDISNTYLKSARTFRKEGRYELARQAYAQALSTAHSTTDMEIIRKELNSITLLLRTMR